MEAADEVHDGEDTHTSEAAIAVVDVGKGIAVVFRNHLKEIN